jgi:hypothetical protein
VNVQRHAISGDKAGPVEFTLKRVIREHLGGPKLLNPFCLEPKPGFLVVLCSGAGLDVSGAGQRTQISLTFSALAGAFMVGVAGARWITNEVDKKLLGESVKVAAKMQISAVECDKLVTGPPKQMLER